MQWDGHYFQRIQDKSAFDCLSSNTKKYVPETNTYGWMELPKGAVGQDLDSILNLIQP